MRFVLLCSESVLLLTLFTAAYYSQPACAMSATAAVLSNSLSDPPPHLRQSSSFNSESTEELSHDGRDEMRRFPEKSEGDWKPWEGRVDLAPATSSGSRISIRQKLEAFAAFVAAVTVAVSANLLTRYTIHELQ